MCVNFFLNDLVIDFDDGLGVDSAARDSDQSNFPDCFTHAMVDVRSCEIPRSVLQADTIVVTCGLANFEQSSWSTHRRHEFWRAHEELHTKEALSRLRPAELLHEKAAVFFPVGTRATIR